MLIEVLLLLWVAGAFIAFMAELGKGDIDDDFTLEGSVFLSCVFWWITLPRWLWHLSVVRRFTFQQLMAQRFWHRKRTFRILWLLLGGRPLPRYSDTSKLKAYIGGLSDQELIDILWMRVVIEGIRNSDRDVIDQLTDELFERHYVPDKVLS